MGKRLEILTFIISIINLLILILGLLFGGISLRYQGEAVNLEKTQTQNTLEETEYNQVMRTYEMAERTIKEQREIINNPNLSCINKSIFLRNEIFLNKARNSLARINLTSAKEYLVEINYTTCSVPTHPTEPETAAPNLSAKSISLFIILLGVILIVLLIMFLKFRKRR